MRILVGCCGGRISRRRWIATTGGGRSSWSWRATTTSRFAIQREVCRSQTYFRGEFKFPPSRPPDTHTQTHKRTQTMTRRAHTVAKNNNDPDRRNFPPVVVVIHPRRERGRRRFHYIRVRRHRRRSIFVIVPTNVDVDVDVDRYDSIRRPSRRTTARASHATDDATYARIVPPR